MRDYGIIHARFWSSKDIRSLSEDGRMLAAYLLTCVHSTLAGVFYIPDGYAAEDLQWTHERVSKGFGELSGNGFATRCEGSKWVWIPKYLDWNPPQNPNQLKAIWRVASKVPTDCSWSLEFKRYLPSVSCRKKNGSASPSETVSKSGSVSGSGSGTSIRTPVGTGAHAGGGISSKANGAGLNGHATRAATGPPPPEPPVFAQIRQLYPARSGGQRWADALDGFNDQLRLGYSEQQMLDGVKRYAAYCRAEQIEGQVCVQAAATFFGRNRGFLEPWTPSGKLSATERWLREQEGADASH